MHAADTKFSHWLEFFAHNSDTNLSHHVFALADGRHAATDGLIVVVANEPANLVIPEQEERIGNRIKSRAEMTTQLLANVPEKSITLPRELVLTMFGAYEHQSSEPCSDCGGTGKVTHYCSCYLCTEDTEPCDNCNGTGKAELSPKCRYTAMWNHPLNANIAAYILAHAPECDEYTLSVCREKEGWHLHIVTSRWHAILVMLKDEVLHEHVCLELITVPNVVGV